MQVCRSLAGYSLGRADIVRRAMAKKKKDVMAKERTAFIYGEKDEKGNVLCEGAVARGVSEEAAKKIFDEMSAFSSYAFNKSHAAAYAVVAYRTAYLKCHYKKEYFAALLTSVLDSTDKIMEYSDECSRMGIKVLKPDVNESNGGFTATENGIRFGLSAIKNLGENLISRLIAERGQNGRYRSFYDFCNRNSGRDLNRRALEGLIKSGAMDTLCENRRKMLYNTDAVLEITEQKKRLGGNNQMGLFSADDREDEPLLEDIDEMPYGQLLELEKEATGLYLSGHPLKKYGAYIKNGGFARISDITAGKYGDGDKVSIVGLFDTVKVRQLKNRNIMVSAVFEDMGGKIPVTAFSNAYAKYRELMAPANVVILTGKISEREDRDTEIVCDTVTAVPESAGSTDNISGGILYIRTDNMESQKTASVLSILIKNHGGDRVVIHCSDNKKTYNVSEKYKFCYSKNAIADLEKLVGSENIKYIE